MAKDIEFDIHVWAKPETKRLSALYTLSIGKRAIAIDMPLDQAVEHLRDVLEEAFNA